MRDIIADLTTVQANVMLAYPLAEAESLLDSKLDVAESSLSNCEEDLDFLREQITVSTCPLEVFGSLLFPRLVLTVRQTMEVATARVYNWDVGQRRKDKDGGKGSGLK